MSSSLLLWVISLFFLSVSIAEAENFSLQTIRNVQNNSLVLARQRSVLREIEADISIAEAALQAEIYLEVGAGVYTRKSSRLSEYRASANIGDFNHVSLSVTHTLWDGHERAYSIEAHRQRKHVEEHRLEYFKQQQLMNAVKADFNVRHDQNVVGILREHLDIVTREASLESARFEHDEATLSDLALVRTHLGNLQTLYQSAAERAGASIIAQRKHSGLQSTGYFAALNISDLLPLTLEAAIRTAEEHHPLLQTNIHLVKQASYLQKQEEAKKHPKLLLEGLVSRDGLPRNDYRDVASLGVRLKIPLFNGDQLNAQEAIGHETVLQARLVQEQEAQAIREGVAFVFHALGAARKRMKIAKRTANNAAEAYRAAVDERNFKVRSTPEMLEIHALFVHALLDERAAARDVRLAEFGLLFAIGRLTVVIFDEQVSNIPVPEPRVLHFKPEIIQAVGDENIVTDQWQGLRVIRSVAAPYRRAPRPRWLSQR